LGVFDTRLARRGGCRPEEGVRFGLALEEHEEAAMGHDALLIELELEALEV